MAMPNRKYQAGGSGYRYGFNGQEKSDDVTIGNYTAEYWEYDSRIGRRWNTDPMAKPNKSPFITFSNNPILKLDPLGNDDYWSIDKSTGKAVYLKQTNTKTHDILIQVGDKFLKLSELKVDFQNEKMIDGLIDIVANYASTANCHLENQNFNASIGISQGTKTSKLAYFDPSDEHLYLNSVEGKINPFSDDAYNLMSTFQHEEKHRQDF